VRSTKSRSWTRLLAEPLPLFAAGEGGRSARHGAGRHGAWSKLLGLAPVPAPPHVFEVDAGAIRYGSFSRRGADWQLERLVESAIAPETFHAGPLGGPLRAREAFEDSLDEVLRQAEESPAAASLVLPDRWLRLLFTDLEEGLGRDPGDEILRFKLKKLVPFRVDDLRLRAAIVPAFPGQVGWRLLLAFAIEQLVRDLEAAFQSRGVRIGQVGSRSLYLMSLLREREDGGLLTVNLETDGYSLCYIADGMPYVLRYRAASVDPSDPGQVGHVAQDLRILIAFLEEHLPAHRIGRALVCGEPESTAPWVDFLRDRFEFASRPLAAQDLPVATPSTNVSWHRVAPLLAAATREIA
jgi:type IV pilus assembly protein PilM